MMVLNIQFWEGDKVMAMALARLIADLEDKPRQDYVLFSARFDCEFDEETIEYVSKKFRVLKYKTKRNATGWPAGPNQMMGCSYEFVYNKWRKGGLPDVDYIMFIEADCVPLRNGWIDELHAEIKGSGKKVLGALIKGGIPGQHVNGNCVVAIDFCRKVPAMLHPPHSIAWDAALSYALIDNACPSRLIWSDYQMGMPQNPWKGDSFLWEAKRYGADHPLGTAELYPCWHHGCKTFDAINAVRKKLLNEP